MNWPTEPSGSGTWRAPEPLESGHDQIRGVPPPLPPSTSIYHPGFFPAAQLPGRPDRARLRPWLVVILAVLIYVALLARGGEARAVAAAGLQVLPFLPLCVFAYISRRADWARVLTLAWWLLLVTGTAAVIFLMSVTALMTPDALKAMATGHKLPPGLPMFRPGSLPIALALFVGVSSSMPLGLLAYVPAVRRVAAKLIPIRADSFVHATALATVVALTVILLAPLAVMGAPLSERLLPLVTERGQAANGEDQLRGMVYSFLWLVPVAFVAVGWPIERTFRETARRLGLLRPKLWHVGLAVAFVPIYYFATDFVEGYIRSVWTYFGWPTTNEMDFDKLIAFAFSPVGAVVVGVTAGFGEEMAARGILQPRLGIFLSNLLWTSVHALQYNWDALLSVFLMGIGFALIRKYSNTTTSALVHGGYDFTLVMLHVLGVAAAVK